MKNIIYIAIFFITIISISCKGSRSYASADFKDIDKFNSIAETDSGFIIRASSDYGYKYFEFKIDESTITLYSDSLYEYASGLNIRYPYSFYKEHLGVFGNRSNQSFNQTGEKINGKYIYKINLKNYSCPDAKPHLSNILFYYNGLGLEHEIEIDSISLRKYIPLFEGRLYTAN